MPRITPKKSKRNGQGDGQGQPALADFPPTPLIGEEVLPDADDTLQMTLLGRMDALRTLPFWEQLAHIGERDWDELSVYLYRLAPKVRNAEPVSFIERVSQAFDESDVKERHGGGKYRAILCERDRRGEIRQHIFEISGAPKILPGQTVLGAEAPAPAPGAALVPAVASADAPVTEDRLLGVVDRILSATQNKQGPDALAAGMDVLKKAMEGSIDMMQKASAASAGAKPAGPLADEMGMLERVIGLVTKMQGGQKESPLDAIAMQLLMERVKNPSGEQNPLLDAIEDLGKTIRDGAGTGGGGAKFDWRAEGVKAFMRLVDSVPNLMAQYRQLQQEEFNRRLAVEDFKRRHGVGQPAPAGSALARVVSISSQARPVTAAQPIAVPAGTGAPDPIAMQPGDVDLFSGPINLIVSSFDKGLSGADTMQLLRGTFPDMVSLLEPQLTSVEVAQQFCQEVPALAELISEAEFPQFLSDFVSEAQTPTDLEPESEPEAPEPAPVA